MKKINIKLHIKSFEQFKDFLQRVIIVFSSNEIAHLEINLIMDALDNYDIERILKFISTYDTFKEISNNTIYTFIVTINPSCKFSKQLTKIRGLLSRINLMGIDDTKKVTCAVKKLQEKQLPVAIILKESDIKDILDRYRKFVPLGIPIFTESDACYDDEFVSLFWEWVYDKDGYRISIFADVLSKILLDYWGTICQYKSCLTKYFVINEDGKIYSCRTQNNEICNLQEIASMDELISKEKFIILLNHSIDKRTRCKELCSFYGICQGGCPKEITLTIENCKNKQLFLAMEEITGKVKSIVNDSDYRDLNPAVREMILSSVASNKLFEKRLFV